ncbi:macrophage-expressed gene 1 protein-like [Acanthaster planci]|uniref:Macrophage-expressed gene 1 protein-like n=1 Tax=Acanthaster planci TaxID=133434 RepID=A0A8B7YUD5_ACAPL|nr:macrophage-expressed gene 1 protein-like [Acanthaster planci]
MALVPAFLFVLGVLLGTSLGGDLRDVSQGSSIDNLPYGDPRRCLLLPEDQRILTFEGLPGGGWDNLRNREAGLVAAINYTQCRFTEDRQFLIPDGTYIIPVKSSKVDTFAELFTHWSNYTSTLSRSINAHAGLNIGHFGISGTFSDEYRSVKSQEYRESSDTVRVQARYVRYTAKLQPDTPLHKAFKTRLLKIAAHHELNMTQMATYESQLLVRDFGTHVVTSIDVGAALTMEDQVLSSYVRKYSSETTQVKASASASFFKVFNFGLGSETTTTKTMIDEYQKSRTSSIINTYGGPVFKPQNYTANNWTAGMENNLVALDRSGDPLYFVITPEVLPEVPESTVYETYESVKAAVELYYKHNVYKGCTKRDSPNFSFIANMDDGTCQPKLTNYTFGGVYQTCERQGIEDLCSGLTQKNPRTGGYSCPPGYEAILLNSDSRSHTTTRHSCHRCWIFAHCCHDNTYHSTARYSAYWCVAEGQLPQQSGFLFGGVYTSKVSNPLTQSLSCPAEFYPLKILSDLTVCVSDDYELGFEYSLPFGGFYSCRSGNPLMVRQAESSSQNRRSLPQGTMSLASFMEQSGPTSWPHGCPKGYSQHLAMVDDGCEINYCIKSGALSSASLPLVNRPPFMPAPQPKNPEGDEVMLTNDGSMWKLLTNSSFDMTSSQQEMSYGPNSQAKSSSNGASLPGGAVAAITVVVTLVCVVVVQVAVITCRSRSKRRQHRPMRDNQPRDVSPLMTDSPTGSQVTYGSTQGEDEPIISVQ